MSPRGITPGFRMLLFFSDRAGWALSAKRRAGLLKAMCLMQEMPADERATR